MSEDRLIYSVNEAASILGVGRTTIYELIREQRLLSVKIGQRRLVAKSDLEAFVTGLRESPAA